MNILIIGGSRGIGKATALELAKAGHRLLLTGRNKDKLEEAAKELPPDTLILPLDVTSEESADRLLLFMEQQGFDVDGLIMNAARFPKAETKTSVIKPNASELSEILEANVVANYRIIQRLLPKLKAGDKIVIIGSTSGIRQDKGGVYGVSKWALRSYAYNLRAECKDYGISVSLVHPGATSTETRQKKSAEDVSLLETSDLGIMIATIFRLSKQAVVEELSIRPIVGDTY
ncbi:SDR family oxidoreductase [Anaerocolumna sp. MB42-C2]|uniref:SDR family oxidoreductase n=1 Tax=Anaerocolumna sp. MB42-C2 TaxID=3070997 RepID=UPI0027E07AB0|nr:SDR family oxidoreductase [Anaerocolumna sp. MB42-C2]WMJ85887.1 SDR family oxidoreductase [Anaerocolumna sp. MB42-C2]